MALSKLFVLATTESVQPVFSIDLEVVNQIFKIGSGCIASAWRAWAYRGSEGMPRGKFLTKRGPEMLFEAFWPHCTGKNV